MSSRSNPLQVKRLLRQEAGFGCCICGSPFIEYHHILNFSEVRRHNPHDMMVLCPEHHHQCTVGALDLNQQRGAKAKPNNIVRGFAYGQFLTPSQIIGISAGSNEFIGAGVKFLIDDESVLSIRSDQNRRLLLTVNLYSQKDELLLQIHDNEWITGDPLPWDLEFGFNLIRLRSAAKKINLEIDARRPLVTLSGSMWRKGHAFSILRDSLTFDGYAVEASFRNVGLVALSVRINSATGWLSLVPETRLGCGTLLGGDDPIKRLEMGISSFEQLCTKARLEQGEECVCGSGLQVANCHPAFCRK